MGKELFGRSDPFLILIFAFFVFMCRSWLGPSGHGLLEVNFHAAF